jgi:hypothetical protein
MKSTIDEPNNLDEPHFDEEATILAARPVVPLDEVRETKRSKGGLALVLAISGGLLIGLLAAALIFRYLSVGEPAAVETTVAEQPAQAVEQPSVELPAPDGGAVAAVDQKAEEDTAAEEPVDTKDNRESKPEESRTVRTPDRTSEVEPRRPVAVRDKPRPADDEPEQEVDRETRRAQKQEERRERRRAARQAERRERQQPGTNDDLTRIREIFEGSPRP